MQNISCPKLVATDRVTPKPLTNPYDGHITFDIPKTLWITCHFLLALCGIIFFFTWSGLLVALLLTGATICAGHSVGMHRLLIHRSFRTQITTERILVWLGTLVGMAGPFGMIQAHDMRDWHQRQTTCPDHPAHRAGFWKDAYWQLCCRYDLTHPPAFAIEPSTQNDPFYLWVEKHWKAQQLFIAIPLFLVGGLSWLLLGISLRVFISLFGHWLVGHFAHRGETQSWTIDGVQVQGFDANLFGWLTFGETGMAIIMRFPIRPSWGY